MRSKVDIAAADCVTTGPVGGYTSPTFPATFCGTSAAAPHAGAIAALIKSAKPGLSASQVISIMKNTALDIEAGGVDFNGGAGLVMANAAVTSVLTPLTVGASFSPSQIKQNQNSTLSITLTNSNSVGLQNISFTDNYPSNVVNAGTPLAAISGAGCSGTLSAAPGGTSLAVSGVTVPAGGSCTITVSVKSSGTGTYVDSTGIVSTQLGLVSSAAGATLTVAAGPAAGSFIPVMMLLLD
jgi:hypothetical protein